MNNEPLISIIVPVYNVEKYLPKCLGSLVNQTYRNIEIICVNDGSKDNSLNILNDYKNIDGRIIIIDKQNEGVSKARNAALKICSGDYVMFVDSDDWIDSNTCETALTSAENKKADVVIWAYKSERDNSSEIRNIFSEDIVFENRTVKDKLHRRFIGIIGDELAAPEKADSLCPVWGKLYRRELLKDIVFINLNEIGTYEDGLFNLYAFESVNKAVYLNHPLYHYRRGNSSSVTSGYRPDLFDQWQNLYRIMFQYIKSNNLPKIYYEALYNRITLGILGLGLNIIASDYSAYKKIKMLREIINTKKYRRAYAMLDFEYFPVHWKVFYGCAKYNMAIVMYLLLLVINKIV